MKVLSLFDGMSSGRIALECESLQTVPLDYTALVSNTQRYKILGNAWTVDIITHLLQGMYAS